MIRLLQTGPINIPLFTTAEREKYLKGTKLIAPVANKPLMRSFDAIIKLRRLAPAGKARKQENERVMDDVESREFSNQVSDMLKLRVFVKVDLQQSSNIEKEKHVWDLKAAREDSNENKNMTRSARRALQAL
ncbi:hypothetical protein OUZ56_032308 [Daphnia magna]|uniref:Uncharacterized protein n=1 Tax=Daphnia magna TaxID=35525 RepID=A0ABQ9ZWS2_9CRUS|nr:hypothetical protein OUZ56_032308 [Daphnia magna]